MIKSSVSSLVNRLNAFDPSRDLLIRIDWKNRTAVGMQDPGALSFIPELFTILSESDVTKRDSLVVISSDMISLIKSALLYYLNHSTTSILIPNKVGFEVLKLTDIILNDYPKSIWVRSGKFKLIRCRVYHWMFSVTSSQYRELVRLSKVKTTE